MFQYNKDFYPTPETIISKMYFKLTDRDNIQNILEPSAGRGDIAEYLEKSKSYSS